METGKDYEKLARELEEKGAVIMESNQTAPELGKEIERRGYKVLYLADCGGIHNEKIQSVAIGWPLKLGKPKRKTVNKAKDVGKYCLELLSLKVL